MPLPEEICRRIYDQCHEGTIKLWKGLLEFTDDEDLDAFGVNKGSVSAAAANAFIKTGSEILLLLVENMDLDGRYDGDELVAPLQEFVEAIRAAIEELNPDGISEYDVRDHTPT